MSEPFDDLRLRDFLLFDRVATLGSISAAARDLGIPKPTAGRWLQALEERVGHTLITRTTRHQALSERGRRFHAAARAVLAAGRAAQAAGTGNEPGGTLRVSVPVPLGRLVGGRVIAAFRADMPLVRLEIALQNARVDLVRDRFDLAIRGGALVDSDLIARRLMRVPMWLYAATKYADVALAELPILAAPGDAQLIAKKRPELTSPVAVVDDRAALADAMSWGAGAGALPAFLGEPRVREGSLVRLDAEPLTVMDVHAVYLRSQRGDPRLRLLVDHIASELRSTLGQQ